MCKECDSGEVEGVCLGYCSVLDGITSDSLSHFHY